METAYVATRLQRQREQFFDAVFMQYIGATLGDLAPGRAEILLHTRPEHLNKDGTVDGGILSSIFDTILSQAIRTIVGVETMSVTIEFKINYLEPAFAGLIIARGEALSVGQSIATASARVTWNDTVVATGLGTFRLFPGAFKSA